jgi:hypothetical protein
MVALTERAETIPFTPAPRARAQRGRSGYSQNFCDNPSDKRPFQRQSPSQQSLLGSCSRDPGGYEGSPWNLYEYVGGQPTASVDPLGLAGTWEPRDPRKGGVMNPPILLPPRPETPAGPCTTFYFGYSPVDPSGDPKQDFCTGLSGAEHVSLCARDCETGEITTVHPGAGGTTRCESGDLSFCKLYPRKTGTMKDGSGINCADATENEIENCLRKLPELPYHKIFSNCHHDAANRSASCCLQFQQCRFVIPGTIVCPRFF